MDETTKPETAIEPYRLGDFAKGEKIDFITQGNVSIPLSIELLKGIVPVKQGDREPSVTEMVMFVNAVIEQKCNCYLNECWLVLIRGKYVPIIAAQKRIAKAQSIPSYDGYEWGWIDKDGNRCSFGPENKVKQADIIGVWGRIYFKDRKLPFYHEIFRSEYKHERNDRPITMLLKTARDQVHKYAFANEMGNLCTENELYDERLPAPVSDVPSRDERRSPLAVPSTAVDTTRAPVQEPDGGKTLAQENQDRADAEVADKTMEDIKAAAEVRTKEANELQEKPGLVTFQCPKCLRTYEYGKEEGKGVQCECGKGVIEEQEKPAEPTSDKEEKPKLDTSTFQTMIKEGDNVPLEAAITAEEKKIEDVKTLYIEVNSMFIAQDGKDFIEFAAYVLCLDDSEIAPSKLTEEQLKQIKAYIETSGVAIN